MAGRREQRGKKLVGLKRNYEELRSRVERLESSEKRLAALNAISSLITQTLEMEQILNSAMEKIAEVMNIEVVLIFRVNRATNELELLAHRGVSQEFLAAMEGIKVGEGFNGGVAASGEAVIVEDIPHDLTLSRDEVRKEGLCAQMIVPLRYEQRIIGTLCVAVRRARQFQPEEIELLTTAGNAICVALENARLYEEQRRIAAELQVSERRHRTLFESANDAIWVHDLEGNITVANEATARLIGYSLEELSHMSVRSFLLEDNLALARQVRDRLFRGEKVDNPYEQKAIRKDGAEVILKLSTNLITADGKPTAFQNIARDITEEKRMQENARFYVQQVVGAQEEERKRIARELHDDTAQVLGSLSREVDNFMRKKTYLLPDEVAFLQYVRQELNRGLQGVHRFSQDLRPPILDDLGLLPALRSLANEMKAYDRIDVELRVLGGERRFTPEVELLIFRIVQEALSNTRRHAGASRAWVAVEFAEGKTRLTISDNGQGFELPGRVDDLPRSGKLGLAGIQERARLLGGTLELQSTPGKGTTLMVEIPN
ncbi:MAG: PAS domain S-box protein [Chloroflexi bacterium]|nr:PAS domain S-box protein [Chloroflexota bacterium]